VTAVRLRLYASARAASGVAEWTADLDRHGTPTIDAALATLPAVEGASLDRVLARCSFLVNAQSTTDRQTPLNDGDLVDVLPPFAGG
jgi:molybdopterin synthase sulfur carrier subunit